MKRLQAPTLLILIILGYFVILTPAIVAIVHGAQSLANMSQKYSANMARIVHLVRDSEAMSRDLVDMERLALQFEVLNDPSFRDVFEKKRETFGEIATRFKDNSGGIEGVDLRIETMLSGLSKVSATLAAEPADQKTTAQTKQRFASLSETYQGFKDHLNEGLDASVSRAESTAKRTRSELIILGLLLVPGTLILIALFTTLIARPIKQLEAVIRRLGKGDYSPDFNVQGPRDIISLAHELELLAASLKSSDQEKKRFLRHISHELKTPLASIKEGTSLLKDEIPGPLCTNQKEVVEIMYSGVENLQSLLNNLLDFNLLRQKRKLEKSWQSIPSMIYELLDHHKLTTDRKGLKLNVSGDKNLKILADQSALRTSLDNIISNAVHFTPDGKSIDISWRKTRKSRGVQFDVRDSGPGIKADERELIFEPFYQGTARKKGPLKGTGLGLSVVKECLSALDGVIDIIDTSDSRGGAHIRIRVPVTCRSEQV